MSDDSIRGRFLWYELKTTDPASAQAFYARVFGWGSQDFDQSAEPYRVFTVGGRGIGGMTTLPPSALSGGERPHWLAYIGAPAVDETVAAAVGRGARQLAAPTDIPTVGRFAVVADPSGALFAPFAPAMPEGEAVPPVREPVAGDFSWRELVAGDLTSAIEFYEALFGWQRLEAHDMGPLGIYQEYGLGGRALGGMFTKPADMPAPPHWLHYVRVADLDRAMGEVASAGGAVLYGPQEVPGGDRIASCLDPQGAPFAMHWQRG